MLEVSPEIIGKTQKSLGKYVKKPTLSEKLLRKPPFRFLHDVIKAVINETGFLDGLFTVDELNSENVKEKEAKVAFLTKLIDAVKTVSKTDLKVRPSKIVAGLEPTETNILLQTIAKSIDRKIDTKDYVAKIQSGETTGKDKSSNKTNRSEKEKDNNKKASSRDRLKKDVNKTKRAGSIETPKSTDRARESSRSKATTKTNKITTNKKDISTNKGDGNSSNNNNNDIAIKKKSNNDLPNNNVIVASVEETIINHQAEGQAPTSSDRPPSSSEAAIALTEETMPSSVVTATAPEDAKPDEKALMANFSNARQSSAGLVRPKSARPKSGDHLPSSRANNVVVSTTGLNRRPSSSLRPPSVRPSSARPGAPRLRPDSALPISEPVVMGNINVIVENFDSGLGDDEDTVVIQNAPEVTDDEEGIQTSELLMNISGENKGQLVEQILEQIHEGQEEGAIVRKRVDIDWEQDGLRGKDATTKEVTQLRSLIQSLTKVANPLGKLMNYLHEDLDAMHNELQMWTSTKKQLYLDIEKQTRLAAESRKPLLDRLELLKQDVKKQEQEILMVRGNILRNEQRIAELLGNNK